MGRKPKWSEQARFPEVSQQARCATALRDLGGSPWQGYSGGSARLDLAPCLLRCGGQSPGRANSARQCCRYRHVECCRAGGRGCSSVPRPTGCRCSVAPTPWFVRGAGSCAAALSWLSPRIANVAVAHAPALSRAGSKPRARKQRLQSWGPKAWLLESEGARKRAHSKARVDSGAVRRYIFTDGY